MDVTEQKAAGVSSGTMLRPPPPHSPGMLYIERPALCDRASFWLYWRFFNIAFTAHLPFAVLQPTLQLPPSWPCSAADHPGGLSLLVNPLPCSPQECFSRAPSEVILFLDTPCCVSPIEDATPNTVGYPTPLAPQHKCGLMSPRSDPVAVQLTWKDIYDTPSPSLSLGYDSGMGDSLSDHNAPRSGSAERRFATEVAEALSPTKENGDARCVAGTAVGIRV